MYVHIYIYILGIVHIHIIGITGIIGIIGIIHHVYIICMWNKPEE